MQYQNIWGMVTGIAACNGMLHRKADKDKIVGPAGKVLSQYRTEDLDDLEAWLGTLSDDAKLTLAKGEEPVRLALVKESPNGVASLFDSVWAAITGTNIHLVKA